MPRDIAYVLFDRWRHGDSGVDTFVRHIEPLFRNGEVPGELVEIPYKEVACRGSESVKPSSTGAGGAAKPPPAWRLAVGYLRRVLHDVRVLWPLRRRLKDRVLVTNQFGCETLPIALRLVRPCNTIVSICHTHPSRTATVQDRARRRIENLSYRAANHVIYNSHSVREEWRKRMGLSSIKGQVIWYGIEPTDRTVPGDYPPKPDGAVDFLCVSRFVRWKGHRELITAFASAVSRSSIPLRLVLIGDGPERPACMSHAGSLSLRVADHRSHAAERQPPPAVVFLGARPNAGRYFNGADVGIQLSTEPEAFGIVLLEAMSCGRPVVASAVGGMPEVVVNGETGILVDPEAPEITARAIVDLARNVHERERMGAAGRERWKEHFTAERMRRNYMQCFMARVVP